MKQQSVTVTWYVDVPDDGGEEYAGVSSVGAVMDTLGDHPEVRFISPVTPASFGEIEEVDG